MEAGIVRGTCESYTGITIDDVELVSVFIVLIINYGLAFFRSGARSFGLFRSRLGTFGLGSWALQGKQ